MSHSRTRTARFAVLAIVLASTGLLASPAAPPAEAATCDGVWVVVDARAAGGSISTRCAEGDPANGLVALREAGHTITDVPGNPGMVCTIDRRPDPCNRAPSDAYWSYWHAPAGGSWTYSNLGAGNRNPAPGTVDGWRFGDGSAPPGTPPPANAPPPASDSDSSGSSSSSSGGSSGSSGSDASSSGGTSSSGTASSGGGSNTGSSGGGGSSGGAGDGATGSGTRSGGASVGAGGSSGQDAETDMTSEDASGAAADGAPEGGEAASGEDGADAGPTWRPDEVEPGGTWEGPSTDAPDTAGGDPSTDTRSPGDEEPETSVLASRATAGGDTPAPVGVLVTVVLLAGIALLTWRQRIQRSRSAP